MPTTTSPTMTTWRRLLAGLAAVALSVSACGANSSSTPVRSYTLHLRADDATDEYEYIAEDPVDLKVGDEVTFEMRNDGTLPHDLQIVGPDGLAVATADPVDGGDSLALTVHFKEPGIYQLNCLVDNHLTEHGMQALVEVVDA